MTSCGMRRAAAAKPAAGGGARLLPRGRLLVAAAAAALLALAPSAARAAIEVVPGEYFTPRLEFHTSDTQAGAHPDLTIAMRKQVRNRCVEPENPTPQNYCRRMVMEQNLKRMTLRFPPGAVSDANAAPYCDAKEVDNPSYPGQRVWICDNDDALVGVVDTTAQWCEPSLYDLYLVTWPDGCFTPDWGGVCESYFYYQHWGPHWPDAPQVPDDGYTYVCRTSGLVFNERPRPGEQGRLVVFWPRQPYELLPPDQWPDPDPDHPWAWYAAIAAKWGAQQKSEISVRVRKEDAGIDSVADVPDSIPGNPPYVIPGQSSDIVMTLFGNVGADKGHPLLTNPTYCDPAALDAEFLGHAVNSGADPNLPGYPYNYAPGYGDGKTVTDSVGVQATGCEQVPYSPNLDLKLSTTKASDVPAVEATVTQPQGEATTQSSTVTFPSGFKVNDKNKATFCSDELIQQSVDDPDKDFCPESSRVGTVEASSHVLPEWEPPLKGAVYLKGLTSDSVEFSALLEGFVDIRFDAKAKLGDDLRITNRFEDLPSVPVSKFTLKLEGGQDKGLLKNPKTCGTQTVRSVFESHSHKQAIRDIPLAIEGCTDPFLDAELSTRKRGAGTNLDLSLSPSLTPKKLDQVEFQLARHLHWGIRGKAEAAAKRKAKGKKKATTLSAGTITFTTPTKDLSLAVAAKRTKRGNVTFTPLARTGQSLGELSTFSASLVRTNRRQPNVTARGRNKRTGKGARRQADLLILSGMPKGDLTGVELSLKGTGKNRSFYLRNPKGCKRPLNFVARARTEDGQAIALGKKVTLKCGRRR